VMLFPKITMGNYKDMDTFVDDVLEKTPEYIYSKKEKIRKKKLKRILK